MELKQGLLAALAPSEEPLELLGHKLVVRELVPQPADAEALKDGVDNLHKYMVRCTFDAETGAPAFADADIPSLKAASPSKLLPLVRAVSRVNGWDRDDAIKNSAAGQSSD